MKQQYTKRRRRRSGVAVDSQPNDRWFESRHMGTKQFFISNLDSFSIHFRLHKHIGKRRRCNNMKHTKISLQKWIQLKLRQKIWSVLTMTIKLNCLEYKMNCRLLRRDVNFYGTWYFYMKKIQLDNFFSLQVLFSFKFTNCHRSWQFHRNTNERMYWCLA